MEKLYYLQNKRGTRPYVGNSILWWANNNCGYTCDIRCARVWTESELKEDELRECDIPWLKDVIDPLVQHHIDMQDLRKDNNGEFRKNPHTLSSWRKDLCV